MRATMLTMALVSVAGVVMESAAAQSLEDRIGTFACTAQAVVGMQPGRDGKRYSGKINPDPERFIIKVEYDPSDVAVTQYKGKYESWWFQAKYNAKFTGRGFYPLRSDDGLMFLDVFGMSSLWFGGNGAYRIVEGALIGSSYLEEGVCARM